MPQENCPYCNTVINLPYGDNQLTPCCGKLVNIFDPNQKKETHHANLITQAELKSVERLREDLKELDIWVKEGLPGAKAASDKIREVLLRIEKENEQQ